MQHQTQVKTDKQPPKAVISDTPHGDANTIGSPDVFLVERHRNLAPGRVRILQVKADGPDRAYVIHGDGRIGYFELSEGMPRKDAEAALNGAYDGQALVL